MKLTENERKFAKRYLAVYTKHNGDIPSNEWVKKDGLSDYRQKLGISMLRARDIGIEVAKEYFSNNENTKTIEYETSNSSINNELISNYKFLIMENKDSLNTKEQLRSYLSQVINELVKATKEDASQEGKNIGQAYVANIVNQATDQIATLFSNPLLRERLEILYEFQKHNLDILKDYKEEIKFAAALQEDIRKERAKFFAETLKDVSGTLKETGVDEKVKSRWIQELVSSYTQSLDMSGRLIKDNTIDTIDSINNDIKNQVDDNSKNK